jgi:hypothetical protein
MRVRRRRLAATRPRARLQSRRDRSLAAPAPTQAITAAESPAYAASARTPFA